jgi:hypothetical protein
LRLFFSNKNFDASTNRFMLIFIFIGNDNNG